MSGLFRLISEHFVCKIAKKNFHPMTHLKLHVNVCFLIPEEQIKREVDEAKAAIKAGDPQKAFGHVSNAARLANRVAMMAKAEIANTEDPTYSQELQRVADNVTASRLNYAKNTHTFTYKHTFLYCGVTNISTNFTIANYKECA